MPPFEMFVFFTSFISDFYIIDIPEILRENSDNHVTTLRQEARAKRLSRGFSGTKTKSYNILTIIANPLLPPPLPRVIQKFTY